MMTLWENETPKCQTVQKHNKSSLYELCTKFQVYWIHTFVLWTDQVLSFKMK